MALGPKEDRLLITGLHTVCDIHCTTCNAVLGWKYVSGRAEPCLRRPPPLRRPALTGAALLPPPLAPAGDCV